MSRMTNCPNRPLPPVTTIFFIEERSPGSMEPINRWRRIQLSCHAERSEASAFAFCRSCKRVRFFVATLLRMTHDWLLSFWDKYFLQLRDPRRVEFIQARERFRRRRPVNGGNFQIGLLGFG